MFGASTWQQATPFGCCSADSSPGGRYGSRQQHTQAHVWRAVWACCTCTPKPCAKWQVLRAAWLADLALAYRWTEQVQEWLVGMMPLGAALW
jgi:hypothetical protein